MNQYENNIESYNLNNINNHQETLQALVNEKNEMSKKLINNHNNFQNQFGDSSSLIMKYNEKFNKYLNLILDRKIKEIEDSYKKENKKKLSKENINNDNNDNKDNNEIIDNNYNNDNNNEKNDNKKNENEINKENIFSPYSNRTFETLVQGINYKSKYEDIRRSIFGEEQNSEYKNSLNGWSKLVVRNDNNNFNDKNFYKTRKKDSLNLSNNYITFKNNNRTFNDYQKKNENHNNKENENENENKINLLNEKIKDEFEENNHNYSNDQYSGNTTCNFKNNYSWDEKDKKTIVNKEELEEDYYQNDFNLDKVTLKNIEESEEKNTNVNLDDYKEIHDNQSVNLLKNNLKRNLECNDSGDNIIDELDNFRKIALEDSSIYLKKNKQDGYN